MVVLTSSTGEVVAVNADLIEMGKASAPFTLLTLVDGRTFLVTETIAEVVQRVVAFRAAVLVAAKDQENLPACPRPPLRVLPRR